MKYNFKDIKNGQIAEGYSVISIVEHEAEITDEADILLAEKHGGELVGTHKSSKQRKPLADEKKIKQPKQDLKQEITEE